MRDFLHSCGLDSAALIALNADASSRRYFRIENADKPYLLMVAPPPEHDLQAFINIDEHLRALGLAAPKIYAQDKTGGYLLLQDFGDDRFSRLLTASAPAPLYSAAIKILRHLQNHSDNTMIDLPPYDAEALLREAELFPLWYMRCELSHPPDEDFMAQYRRLIKTAIDALPSLPPCLVLRDYHIDNLMQINGFAIGKDSALQACGILDFQDALIGSPAYDVMSILEDARTPVPQALQTALLDEYLRQSGFDKQDFMAHYTVLALIRHLKVLGIFVRLAVRDNKPHYRGYLAHVKDLSQKHLRQSEIWRELRDFLSRSIPDF